MVILLDEMLMNSATWILLLIMRSQLAAREMLSEAVIKLLSAQ